jgi:hypothetical protein
VERLRRGGVLGVRAGAGRASKLVMNSVKVQARIVGVLLVTIVVGSGLTALAPPTAAAPNVADASRGSQIADPSPIPSSPPRLSTPVRDLEPSNDASSDPEAAPPRNDPLALSTDRGTAGTPNGGPAPPDPLVPRLTTTATPHGPSPSLVFEGTGNPEGCGSCAPPDTTGDVGPNHYIQMVNATKVAIYDKHGVLLRAAFNLSALFASGACSQPDAGDPQVLYDPLADRWLLSQFTGGDSNGLCFAISQTADPLGSWYLYSFSTPDFPDYFKVGVWPSGYYVSTNEDTYTAYSLDRTKMLAGLPANAVRVPGQTNMLMPADVDGSSAPSESGGLFYTFKSKEFPSHGVVTDRLEVFRMTPDFDTPANTTFTTIATIPIAPFTFTVCGFFELGCIPQKGTDQKVDAVSEWPMQRFAYRRLGDRETLVGNFTVGGGTAVPGAAIRWFELADTGSGWTLRQEGTQDLGDGLNRFMGSIAMDADGNIALGYSASSASEYPSIRYATRSASDPLGTMPSEQIMRSGGGSQTRADRWGDYSAMSVDPATDRVFWYTNEYYATSSARTWATAIGTFGFTAQTITFGPPPAAVITAGTARLTATGGGSGNPVVFTSATPAICTTGGADSATVTLVAVGTCTIDADQAGDGSFNPAPQVTQSFAIVRASQTVTMPPMADVTFGVAPFDLPVAPTATSDLRVVVTSATATTCTISNRVVMVTGAGVCTLTGSQPGDSRYDPAPPVRVSFQVDKAPQTLTMPGLPGRIALHESIALPPGSLVASSGLPVTLVSLTPDVCTVEGLVITPVKAGVCTVAAEQAGDANYLGATVTRSVTVSAATVRGVLPVTGAGHVTAAAGAGGACIIVGWMLVLIVRRRRVIRSEPDPGWDPVR